MLLYSASLAGILLPNFSQPWKTHCGSQRDRGWGGGLCRREEESCSGQAVSFCYWYEVDRPNISPGVACSPMHAWGKKSCGLESVYSGSLIWPHWLTAHMVEGVDSSTQGTGCLFESPKQLFKLKKWNRVTIQFRVCQNWTAAPKTCYLAKNGHWHFCHTSVLTIQQTVPKLNICSDQGTLVTN